MARENARARGRRLVSEGRLTVSRVTQELVIAHCRGDSGVIHMVTADPGGWVCSCPALRTCAHVVALKLVVLQPNGDRTKP